MKTFRFIGARTEVRPGPTLTKLGQKFEALEADVLTDGGIPALPEADFDDIFEDIPPEMLERYALAETRIDPPAELAAAIKAAAIRLHELRGGK